jgi:hypothetical protein
MQGRIGLHSYSIEGYVLHLRYVGDLTHAHLCEIFAIAQAIQKLEAKLFLLTDASKVGRVHPEARRYAYEWLRNHPYNGSVVYGANVIIQTVVMLLLRALSLVSAQPTPVVLVATEQEARTWIRARAGTGPPQR